MKILAVSDQIAENLYSPTVAGRLGAVDLIVGCGDLPYYYLEYLMTMLGAPLLYVHGNHDPLAEYCGPDGKSQKAGPDGGEDVDLRCATVGGKLVAGLEGCIHYRPSDAYQYTQNEMWLRTAALAALLAPNRLLRAASWTSWSPTRRPSASMTAGMPPTSVSVLSDLHARLPAALPAARPRASHRRRWPPR